MTTSTAWPFGKDADRRDPLTARRIAVTSSHPAWSYLVAFHRDSGTRPTDAEAAMLASYLEEWKQRWYTSTYLAKMAQRPLDVDGTANGLVFHKFGPGDWGYRRHSFNRGNLWTVQGPARRTANSHGPYSLLALLDWLHTHASTEPAPSWQAWKAAHPATFAQATVTPDSEFRAKAAAAGLSVHTTPDRVHRVDLANGDVIAVGWEPMVGDPEVAWWDATLYSGDSETKFFEGTGLVALVEKIEIAATFTGKP